MRNAVTNSQRIICAENLQSLTPVRLLYHIRNLFQLFFDKKLLFLPLRIQRLISGTSLLYLGYLVFILRIGVPALEGISFSGRIFQLDCRCRDIVFRRILAAVLPLVQVVGNRVFCLRPLRVQRFVSGTSLLYLGYLILVL